MKKNLIRRVFLELGRLKNILNFIDERYIFSKKAGMA